MSSLNFVSLGHVQCPKWSLSTFARNFKRLAKKTDKRRTYLYGIFFNFLQQILIHIKSPHYARNEIHIKRHKIQRYGFNKEKNTNVT